MFKIGDFSRLSQVSVKALRYYDEVGLLKPAHVDRFTGYRFYTADQLPRLNRILAYKDLGFSLEQIRQLLDEDVPAAQLRGMLRLRQAEIQRHMAAEQSRLARIATRLHQIEQEDTHPVYDVVLKHVEPLQVVSIRETLGSFRDIMRLFDELEAYLQADGAHPQMWLALWHTTDAEQGIDGEAAAVIDSPLPTHQRVGVRELPAVQVASVVHHGTLNTLVRPYQALLAWIDANDYQIVGPARDIYIQAENDQDDPSYVTEVQYPVDKTTV